MHQSLFHNKVNKRELESKLESGLDIYYQVYTKYKYLITKSENYSKYIAHGICKFVSWTHLEMKYRWWKHLVWLLLNPTTTLINIITRLGVTPLSYPSRSHLVTSVPLLEITIIPFLIIYRTWPNLVVMFDGSSSWIMKKFVIPTVLVVFASVLPWIIHCSPSY